jgi:hypothetical protein
VKRNVGSVSSVLVFLEESFSSIRQRFVSQHLENELPLDSFEVIPLRQHLSVPSNSYVTITKTTKTTKIVIDKFVFKNNLNTINKEFIINVHLFS